ncbi:Clan CA, family C1, cathepsin L-like cysteine peptidase [Trichomonas vaginalis G3]|uniref:Clan CA, family C1, cathepsin L-like cysteine peptidase n=1 Tax=Trichomonas vaginalis (strain ATCC PRA-98 / G3) TaxID=412133 RepID=A2EM51_TRIV3|nr:cysteine-type peptidase protein [Trichomonas vaginalis G3]EAY06235.1 Clan CA, family C1, cathepsin L-like cysteine peptidase [Trichomonas vaginalis G3]KAI5505184.1 cysteine-type peptidase protein [Trichomonas vaginalis G3]|eukprot:XP_001318458.1 Clan CA, family C1, cathepsin L-like cysteine peptidase [Trichomonas vaginalis G3]
MFAFAALSRSVLTTQAEEKAFLDWMRQTNNIFVGEEFHFRKGIFLTHKRFVEEHNRKSSFRCGLNQFAHLTPSEYQELLGYKQMKQKEEVEFAPLKNFNAPDSFDWREKGVVNAIKDQGQCGSCWAFSSIQAQESQWAIHHPGELYDLAEQQLVDCVHDCFGCNGGNVGWAYTWVKLFEHGMFMLQKDYPYTAKDGKCAFDKSKGITKITTHKKASHDEEALKTSVAENGPHAIAIDAGHDSFMMYESGVYEDASCSSSTLDHAVGLVGYGVDGDKDFWLVRNSWSTTWGEQGYVRIRRNYHNMCGVASEPMFPVVE